MALYQSESVCLGGGGSVVLEVPESVGLTECCVGPGMTFRRHRGPPFDLRQTSAEHGARGGKRRNSSASVIHDAVELGVRKGLCMTLEPLGGDNEDLWENLHFFLEFLLL